MTALFNQYIEDPDFTQSKENKVFDLFLDKARTNVPLFFSMLSDEQIKYFHQQIDALIYDIEDLQQRNN